MSPKAAKRLQAHAHTWDKDSVDQNRKQTRSPPPSPRPEPFFFPHPAREVSSPLMERQRVTKIHTLTPKKSLKTLFGLYNSGSGKGLGTSTSASTSQCQLATQIASIIETQKSQKPLPPIFRLAAPPGSLQATPSMNMTRPYPSNFKGEVFRPSVSQGMARGMITLGDRDVKKADSAPHVSRQQHQNPGPSLGSPSMPKTTGPPSPRSNSRVPYDNSAQFSPAISSPPFQDTPYQAYRGRVQGIPASRNRGEALEIGAGELANYLYVTSDSNFSRFPLPPPPMTPTTPTPTTPSGNPTARSPHHQSPRSTTSMTASPSDLSPISPTEWLILPPSQIIPPASNEGNPFPFIVSEYESGVGIGYSSEAKTTEDLIVSPVLSSSPESMHSLLDALESNKRRLSNGNLLPKNLERETPIQEEPERVSSIHSDEDWALKLVEAYATMEDDDECTTQVGRGSDYVSGTIQDSAGSGVIRQRGDCPMLTFSLISFDYNKQRRSSISPERSLIVDHDKLDIIYQSPIFSKF